MCRNIRPLFNFDPPVTEDEIRAASLQFVRKISGFHKPSKANEASFHAAIDEIARKVKKTRDETFVAQDAQGRTVNRCESIEWNGGCTDTNEFNYLVVKTMRSLGVVNLENQARV